MKQNLSYLLIFFLLIQVKLLFAQIETTNPKRNKANSDQEYLIQFKNCLLTISQYELQKNPDSLCNAYKGTGDLCYEWKIYDKANEYFNKAYSICSNLKNKNNIVFQKLIDNVANTYYLMQKYDSALQYYQTLYNFQQKEDLKREEILTLSKIVTIYLNEKKYNKSLECNTQILTLNTELKDEKNIGVSLNNIGFNCILLNDFHNAIINFRTAIKMFKSLNLKDSAEYQVALLNLGILYQNTKDYENANHYLTELENILVRNNKKGSLAELYNIKASISFLQNDKEQAITYCEQAESLAISTNDLSVLKAVYLNFSQIYQNQNDHNRALIYYQKYKSISDSVSNASHAEEKKILNRIIQTSSIENQLKILAVEKEIAELDVKNIRLEAEKNEQAYQIQIRNQQIENQNKIRDLLIQQQKFEADRQEKKILILNQQNELQKLALKQNKLEQAEKEKAIDLLSKSKKLLEKDKEIAQQKAVKQRLLIILFGAGFVLFSLFTLFFFRSKQKEHRTNLILADQYAEIEEKTEEISVQRDMLFQQKKNITDSIEYARFIQQALLTSHEILSNSQLRNFILFKPRDIISGDFYWFKQMKNFIYFTAADCTGHGVPGAFMSVLGISLLNEIVSKRDLNPPALVLNEFRKRLKKSLHQDRLDTMSHDGIDITLCLYDTETQQLQYSGAYNPLILIRNNELVVYETDRMPVGMHPKDHNDFTNHEIQLLSGDSLYLFSDGFYSQFGGDEGKKFNVKRFTQLLLDVHNEPMELQEQKLNTSLIAWQGNYEQVDDVLVLGIKI
jgi:serine phosphatase RsbU (regulator of sigma subunit)